MTGLFFRLELSRWRRDPRLWPWLVSTLLGVALATVWATAGDIARQDAQHAATIEARTQWEGKGAANPHGMAHFGDFAFRPTGPLAQLDRGVQARLGKVLRLEGHRQGTPLHSDQDKAGTLARFDRLDAAFVLQILVPLLLIFLGSTALAADREEGRLRLSLVQGASARAVMAGRFFALWGLGLVCIAVVLLASLTTSSVVGSGLNLSLERSLGFALAYALFLAVVSAGILSVAIWTRRAGTALVILLVLWVVATAVFPRATESAAASLYALPSRDVFQAQLDSARAAGPDGHNAQDATLAKMEKEALVKYGVDTVEELPINFDGVRMQVDEEFGNRIWDEHYRVLSAQMNRQLTVASLAAVLNPFQAVDHVSMALAGTDMFHDLAFQEQAETHRRSMIEKLNNEHAYGGSKTGDWDWNASAEFFADIEEFRYQTPALGDALEPRGVELASLLLWLVLVVVAMMYGADRVERGSLPC